MFKKRSLAIQTLQELVSSGRVTSMLALGSTNEGPLKLKLGVKVDGEQVGGISISGTKGVLWVSDSGVVKGDANVPTAYIYGAFTGTLVADLVVLGGGAKISGQIYTDQIQFQDLQRVQMRAEIAAKSAAKDQEELPSQLTPITKLELASPVAA